MGFEEHAVSVLNILEDSVLCAKVADLEGAEVIPHALEVSNVVIEVLANGRKLLLAGIVSLTLLVSLGAGLFETGKFLLQLFHAVSKKRVALLLELLDFETQFLLELGELAVTRIDVHVDDHVSREVDDLFEVLRCHVQEVSQTARNALEVPNVGDRSCKLDVPHALTTNGGLGDLHAAALTDDSLEAHALVLATRTLPVTTGAEDLLSEETILLGLQGAVVDSFGLLHLTVGPATDVL